MTVVAVVAAGNVRRVFPYRRDTVVARGASADNLCVIDRVHRCEDIGCVTVLAHITGENVRWSFAGRIGAVVAARTVTGNVDMIEVRR